jgi:hypothetical protein
MLKTIFIILGAAAGVTISQGFFQNPADLNSLLAPFQNFNPANFDINSLLQSGPLQKGLIGLGSGGVVGLVVEIILSKILKKPQAN